MTTIRHIIIFQSFASSSLSNSASANIASADLEAAEVEAFFYLLPATTSGMPSITALYGYDPPNVIQYSGPKYLYATDTYVHFAGAIP